MLTNLQKTQLTQLIPNVYLNNRPQTLTINQQIAAMREDISHLVSLTCNSQSNIVQYNMRASPPNLENCTDSAQDVIDEKGVSPMAYHRIRLCVGYNDDGSAIIKQVSANSEIELCDRIVKAMLSSERRSEFIGESDKDKPAKEIPTFESYALSWLKTYKVRKLKPTTLHGYNVMLNAHLIPAFGSLKISEINATTIQAFWDERSKLSKKYLREMKALLAQILESAKLDQIILNNPAKDNRLICPSNKVAIREAVDENDLRTIIANMPLLSEDTDRVYLALAIFSGARKGEILGLQWRDVDLTAHEISIRQNVTFTANQPIIGSPKTEAGYRTIPIPPALLEYLKGGEPDNYVVGNDKKPLTYRKHYCMMKRIDREIGLHGATSHCFRHTLGTILNDCGASIKTIQAILGQSDFKTTSDRYVHGIKSREIEAAKAVSDYLCPQSSDSKVL